MGEIRATFNFEGLDKLLKVAEGLGKAGAYAVNRATDEVGNKLFTKMKRSVADQAGVSYARAGQAMVRRQAMGTGGGSFIITARDTTMSLKEFGPRKTAKGVSAAPWKKRRVFPHTFIGPGGHVFVREGKARLPIKKLYGPAIPKEMVKDQTEAVFYAYTAQAMPAALEKWIFKFLP